jgi:hypothetical protein
MQSNNGEEAQMESKKEGLTGRIAVLLLLIPFLVILLNMFVL